MVAILRSIAASRIVQVALGALGITLFALAFWTGGNPDLYGNVVADWDSNIGRLGIEPVYPPQEDIVVGDIYALIVNDRLNKQKISDSLAGRSVKIDRVDMADEVKKYLEGVYVFPETQARPASGGDIWKQADAKAAIFEPVPDRRAMPLVLFPGISIAKTRNVAASFAGIFYSIAAKFGIARARSESIDLRIPAAETYGVTSLVASERLARYCYAKETRDACTDQAIRNQLSMLVGDAILAPLPAGGGYRYNVEVALISRVYMVRAIDSVSDTEAATSGSADAGTSTSMRNSEGRKIVATQVFQRPVVIGYRAVRTTPIDLKN